MNTLDKLIEDIEDEIDRLERLCNQKPSSYMLGQINAYIQVLTILKGL